MRHYDEELRELQQQAAMKSRLETIIKELRTQKSTLEFRVEELSLICPLTGMVLLFLECTAGIYLVYQNYKSILGRYS